MTSISPPALHRAWKHPFNVDTWDSLAEAKEAHPHLRCFGRVWAVRASEGHVTRQSSHIVRDRFTLTWRRSMDEDNPDIVATATAILSRRQQRQVTPSVALWPVLVEDVRGLSLSQENETAILRALYRLIFHRP